MLLLASALVLSSCAGDPVIYETSEKSLVWMGGHFADKVGSEKKTYAGRHGTVTVDRTNLDASQVPKAITTAYGMVALSADQLSAHKATEGTTRKLAQEETSRAATKGAQDVQIKALDSPLSEGFTPQPIPR